MNHQKKKGTKKERGNACHRLLDTRERKKLTVCLHLAQNTDPLCFSPHLIFKRPGNDKGRILFALFTNAQKNEFLVKIYF